jgi:hypothetical protein
MAQANVTLSATLFGGSNVKRFSWRRKATARQVLAKRGFDVIRNGNGPLHISSILSPPHTGRHRHSPDQSRHFSRLLIDFHFARLFAAIG